jgi:amidohydrolase
MKVRSAAAVLAALLVAPTLAPSAGAQQSWDLDAIAESLESKVIEWRRDFHQNPELSNREFRTAAIVAAHLESLGIDVTTGVAHTGVVGILRGGKPGPVVALRADMDALPVPERNDLPFRSTATGEYRGETVPVMHACGHDTHVAILMGVAEAFAARRNDLAGTLKFVFQPAEEGSPEGEEGGAELMAKEGVLENPDVDAIFGLHISADTDVGTIDYRSGPLMAAVQDFRIVVKGRQSHGASPAQGIDPIVTGAQIVTALQTVVSRSLDLTLNPAVVTVGSFHGGVRSNIIPEEVEMLGTIRTFDPEQTALVHRRIREIATNIAASAGAVAEVQIPHTTDYPVTHNDPELAVSSIEALRRVAGADNLREINPIGGAEDFSFYVERVPGFFFFLGGKPLDVAAEDAAAHHTPDFFIDESGLALGVKTMMAVTLDYIDRSSLSGNR